MHHQHSCTNFLIQIDDINIPGTLNVGDTFPVIFEAFILHNFCKCRILSSYG